TSGMVQRQTLFAPISLESNRGLSNKRASVAMARTNDPNSANAQFFVNVVDNAFLDYSSDSSPGYAVFGEVVRGMEVIDARLLLRPRLLSKLIGANKVWRCTIPLVNPPPCTTNPAMTR
ncbi:MAG: hypothetical protein EB006_13360, partial [Betaproteobacteria bacterium]|nr:hypothetical protein [Betaproteobacteria bacterium]